jgi:hypothetical protein
MPDIAVGREALGPRLRLGSAALERWRCRADAVLSCGETPVRVV